MSDNPLLKWAIWYATSKRWKIHPCILKKRPYLEDWPNKATDDIDIIKNWWSEYPNASIGCKCGPDSNIFVLDIDLPDGPDSIKKIEAEHGKLPATLTQITGSGGEQRIFQYQDNIRNSASKVGRHLDIRGDGGYVILPPSPHPSGNPYRWVDPKSPIAKPPAWFVNLVKSKPERTKNRIIHNGPNTRYGITALINMITELSNAGNGTRNDTLNRISFSAGQLIAGGELEESYAMAAILNTALSIGLSEKETIATINSGFRAGKCDPRSAPKKDDFVYIDDTLSQNNGDNHGDNRDNNSNYVSACKQNAENDEICKQVKADVRACKQDVSIMSAKCKQDVSKGPNHVSNVSRSKQDSSKRSTHTIMGAIRHFIENSTGSFTTRDIDFELGLSTRAEKNARSRALSIYREKRLIIKDKRIVGKWHILDTNVNWIDYNGKPETQFPIRLPFDLHKHVVIPPKAIIILAGSSNSGKTAICLNTLRDNLHQDYEIVYLMSEMGEGEYLSRIRNFGDDNGYWQRVKAASKSTGFDGIISKFNPDGLTCVDYLEDVQGEYFRIPADIRAIYDSLGNGVALVALQKHSEGGIARGGEGTLEKARLYLSVDTLVVKEASIICALKIVKLKNFINKNLQNHEIHFEITRGCQIQPLSGWFYSSQKRRAQKIKEYKQNEVDGYLYFMTESGKQVRITVEQAEQWSKRFKNINVFDELDRIGSQSKERPFIDDKGWFFQIPGILDKKNKKIGRRC